MSREPQFCRPEAYRLFVDSLHGINSTTGLVRAATAIAMHALDDVQWEDVESRLDALAQRVRERAPSGQVAARVAHLHEVLFVDDGFAGDTEKYYVALNSYLPAVLNSRRGLPILLALIYKAVGERVGLRIDGINSPSHFLVRVQDGEGSIYVDPFFHGQMLSREEAFQRLAQISGREIPRDDRYLPVAAPQEWLARILANLQALFAEQKCDHDLAAMTELQEALQQSLW